MLYKVEEDKTLVRDSENGAILNTNRAGLQEYRAEKRRRNADSTRLDAVCKDVEEIKTLLKAVLEHLGK